MTFFFKDLYALQQRQQRFQAHAAAAFEQHQLAGGRVPGQPHGRRRFVVEVVGSGLRGGGHALSDEDVRALPIAGSLTEMAEAVAALLDATFGGVPANPPAPQER